MNKNLLEILAGKQNETEQKLHLMTSNTVTIPHNHISIVPIKAIKQLINNNFKPNDLIEIEANPFLTTEQELILIPMLQKLQNLGSQTPNVYMALLWNPGGQTKILKQNKTISSAKELDCMENVPLDQ